MADEKSRLHLLTVVSAMPVYANYQLRVNEPDRNYYRLSLLEGSLTLLFDSFKLEDVGA